MPGQLRVIRVTRDAPLTQPALLCGDESPSNNALVQNSRPRRPRQIHFWISETDYQSLRSLAEAEGEPMSALIRRWIRQLLRDVKAARESRAA